MHRVGRLPVEFGLSAFHFVEKARNASDWQLQFLESPIVPSSQGPGLLRRHPSHTSYSTDAGMVGNRLGPEKVRFSGQFLHVAQARQIVPDLSLALVRRCLGAGAPDVDRRLTEALRQAGLE